MKYLMLLLLSSTCMAQTAYDYKIHGKNLKMYQYDSARIMTNQKCDKIKNNQLCPNLGFLKKISTKKLTGSTDGGVGIGSLICKEQLDGQIVLGRTPANDQNTFCKLKEMYIDTSTLEYYGDRNN